MPSGNETLLKQRVSHTGLITTQVLMHTDAGDVLVSDAIVQLYAKNGKTLIAEFQFQPAGDPYPGYWRCFNVDTSATYVVKCIPPAQYSGRTIFSCLTAQFGVGTINSASFTLKPSDWLWAPVWGQGQAYPRQFYISTQ